MEIDKKFVYLYSFHILLGGVNFGNCSYYHKGYFFIEHRIGSILKFYVGENISSNDAAILLSNLTYGAGLIGSLISGLLVLL